MGKGGAVPKQDNGRQRVIIEQVAPEIDGGRFPIKRVIGEKVAVSADLFADGHDVLLGRLLYRKSGAKDWSVVPMRFFNNDRWQGEFSVQELGEYVYTLEAWVDPFRSWQRDLKKKVEAGQQISVDLMIGITLLEAIMKEAPESERGRIGSIVRQLRTLKDPQQTIDVVFGEELDALVDRHGTRPFTSRYAKELLVTVDRPKALFSTWYERFPRSCSTKQGRHGTLKDCEAILPEVARMGFDVFYLPPIHPIGKKNRKGRNNSPTAGPDDPGSPWAIGSDEGGHTAVHPQLGTLDDFDRLVRKGKDLGVEIAMDLAYQCAPDHPYVKAHPEWFRWRPDGTVQYAENPPKRYEDILPLNFETDAWKELWEELKSVVLFWIDHGVRIFRVDNPHTKAFPFWEWMIGDIRRKYPETIFLSEAFTRPKVMARLAKVGFTQSYTYFTWRTTAHELQTYLTELTQTELSEYFRPNFWPNTPDILPQHLQFGGRPTFLMRLVLAATLSSNYGIYGPAYELCVNEAIPGKEEYLHSEKYEFKLWDWDRPGNLKDFITRINRIRRENPALQITRNVKFFESDNPQFLFYVKATDDLSNIILVVVNLDPFHTHSGWLKVPIWEWDLPADQPYLVHDLISDEKYIWQGERNYVNLNPHTVPAHIFRVSRRMKRETDFDYFM